MGVIELALRPIVGIADCAARDNADGHGHKSFGCVLYLIKLQNAISVHGSIQRMDNYSTQILEA